MRLRTIALAAVGAGVLLGAASPAWADREDWRRQEWRRQEWREHESRARAWREHEWREHLWNERHSLHYYNPPVAVAPAYPYPTYPQWYR